MMQQSLDGTCTAPGGRSYNAALSSLLSLQSITPSSILQQGSKRKDTVSDMREYMELVGLDWRNGSGRGPRVVHVTGTKGKGSTVCMAETLLRLMHKSNTGMFTSPHLVNVRERIRLNGEPVGESEFAKRYWELYELLEKKKRDGRRSHPTYFRFLTLLAIYIFDRHRFKDGSKIDFVLLEVGMGGRFDATNIYESSVASCITTLDMDHTRVLGDTIEKIAWEKGGIMKRGCQTFTVDQGGGANDVLRACADECGASLTVIKDAASLVDPNWELGLKGDFQVVNAALAVALSRLATGNSPGSGVGNFDKREGGFLRASRWPGRCQHLVRGKNNF